MNRKVRKLLASVVLGVCLLALSFIPSFAANSANSASVGNVEAMKENVVYDFQSLSFADAPDSVSYTHLDVYKRQVSGYRDASLCGIQGTACT